MWLLSGNDFGISPHFRCDEMVWLLVFHDGLLLGSVRVGACALFVEVDQSSPLADMLCVCVMQLFMWKVQATSQAHSYIMKNENENEHNGKTRRQNKTQPSSRVVCVFVSCCVCARACVPVRAFLFY